MYIVKESWKRGHKKRTGIVGAHSQKAYFCRLQGLQTTWTAQNVFFNPRKIYNRKKWKNYVIVAKVELNFELDAIVIREQSIFI